ncbi:MAG: hypothetical protein JWQ87_3876 [Candidatus Sulfotelmatobacter sp.]|nr:hypothetical protein [Candidatus Sulfotelmatobacter sp.]
MFNQLENFKMAIRKKRAKIEEINLICAQPPRKGVTQGSRRRLIEERLHLELAVSELENEIRRLQFQESERLFRWEDLDQRLLSAKTNDLAEEMSRRVTEGRQRVEFETARSGNSAGFESRWFDFHEQLAEERAQRLYAAYCETWTQQNRSITPAFIRAVRDRVIAHALAALKSSVISGLVSRSRRTNKPANSAAIGSWSRRMDALANRWNRKLEAEAVAAEYRAATPAQANARDLPQRSSVMPEERTSPLASNIWNGFHKIFRALAEEEGRSEPSKLHNNAPKTGRKLIRTEDFVACAGKLWLEAKRQNGNSIVKGEQLIEIASRLDDVKHVPPANFLEARYAKDLRAFNSKNSHSRIGSIQTWSRLVAYGDKDHIRGMRKLLSRCAQTLS